MNVLCPETAADWQSLGLAPALGFGRSLLDSLGQSRTEVIVTPTSAARHQTFIKGIIRFDINLPSHITVRSLANIQASGQTATTRPAVELHNTRSRI